ncbi:hypothetical protein PV963_43325 [Streptomyces coeruleorubidus]|uniref:hypothetical protein n=1 Tax=Streptomyces coeruleorubidus TaxID=116188 RepID=UPI00237FCD82|nr:hypothetical protein [Streptomyces coeruleorubidus]WDV56660.1 hypothetical protein PV963_43325 [Streptomyces coeruleorubidus]
MYRSPATEWDPADGMYGFITRVWDWFQAAAAGELDTPGEPLHPPNALTHQSARPAGRPPRCPHRTGRTLDRRGPYTPGPRRPPGRGRLAAPGLLAHQR